MIVASQGTEALAIYPSSSSGLASDAGTWTSMAQFLAAQGWQFGGVPTFVPATLGVTTASAGHFYAMNFSDWDTRPFPSQNLSLDRQGYELAAVIQEVLNANPGAQRVILVAHSMGGLAARAYLQGLARVTLCRAITIAVISSGSLRSAPPSGIAASLSASRCLGGPGIHRP
jgi:triacylglycerol esterase/lipase EstA (alpha/beta hydrolase family)